MKPNRIRICGRDTSTPRPRRIALRPAGCAASLGHVRLHPRAELAHASCDQVHGASRPTEHGLERGNISAARITSPGGGCSAQWSSLAVSGLPSSGMCTQAASNSPTRRWLCAARGGRDARHVTALAGRRRLCPAAAVPVPPAGPVRPLRTATASTTRDAELGLQARHVDVMRGFTSPGPSC